MLLLETILLGVFIANVLTDDDDDHRGGMMIPTHNSIQFINSVLYKEQSFFCIMPRGQIDKEEMKCHVLKLKSQVDSDKGYPGEKEIAQKYLNKVLDKIEEYRF